MKKILVIILLLVVIVILLYDKYTRKCLQPQAVQIANLREKFRFLIPPPAPAKVVSDKRTCQLDKPFKFYGQGVEFDAATDKTVFETFFKNKCHGVFIDIGANDGHTHSNSKFFNEQLAWDGVCVEPSPKTFRLLDQNRKHCDNYNLGFSSKEAPLEFWQTEGHTNELSGFAEFMEPSHKERYVREAKNANVVIEKIMVKSVRLGTFLKNLEIKHVDFITLDAEGAELSILETFDFSVDVSLWIIEDNVKQALIEQLLKKHGYHKCGNDKWKINSFYCKNNHKF